MQKYQFRADRLGVPPAGTDRSQSIGDKSDLTNQSITLFGPEYTVNKDQTTTQDVAGQELVTSRNLNTEQEYIN